MRTNSGYLTLALDIRKLSDALISLAEDGVEAPPMFDAITRLVLSLEGLGQQTSVKALRDRGNFGRHESVVTVNEAITDDQRKELIQKLKAILRTEAREVKQENALEAVAFFDTLERRALYRYNHPVRAIA
jgi:hypothetical protein